MDSGPGGSHHRRLKTRLTVRMMPRRRTNGSQVFTKAPTLTGRRDGSPNGKGPRSGVCFIEPCPPTGPYGAAAAKEAPGTTPSPPDLVSQGNRPSLARHRRCRVTGSSPGQGLFQVSGRHLTSHWASTRDAPTPSLGLTAPSTMSSLWGGLESRCGSPLMRPSGKRGVGGSQHSAVAGAEGLGVRALPQCLCDCGYSLLWGPLKDFRN